MSLKIVCEKRDEKGKNAAGRLRRKGTIPGNLVSGGKSEPIIVNESDFMRLLAAGLRQSSVMQAEVVGGENAQVLVKEIQRHPVTGKVLHLDLYKTVQGHKVRVRVPVELEGFSKGVKAGGALEHYIRNLRVRATPESLIDVLKVDINNLDVGDSVHLNELDIPKSWEVLIQGNPIICKVARSRLTTQSDTPEATATAAPAAAPAKK